MHTIWAKNGTEKNRELVFSAQLNGRRPTLLKIAAKNVYTLFINGVYAGYGPARTAKGYARIDEREIEDFLRDGTNIITVRVVNYYTKTLCFAKENGMFAAEAERGGKIVLSTEDFLCRDATDRVRKTDRISSQRGFTEVYYMSESREKKDARPVSGNDAIETTKIVSPVFLSRRTAVSVPKRTDYRAFESGVVQFDEQAVWENDLTKLLDEGSPLDAFPRSECTVSLSKILPEMNFRAEEKIGNDEWGYTYYRAPYICCGVFEIALTAETDAEVYLVYDDILIDGKIRFNREQIVHGMKWTLKKGKYVLRTTDVYSAKYIGLIAKKGVTTERVSVYEESNPDADRFHFHSDNAALQKITEAARRTFALNACDLLTDCPSRERAGWLCDSYFSAQAEKLFTGKNAAESDFIENFILFDGSGLLPKGALPMCYPSEVKKNRYIPNWILWFILELADYRERGGDERVGERAKSLIKNACEFFAGYENEYGLLENLEGWVFVEWSKSNDYTAGVNYPSNMLYAGALDAAATLLKDNRLREKAENLRQTIKNRAYDGEFFKDQAIREGGKLTERDVCTETCQYYAAFFQILSGAEGEEFLNKLIGHFGLTRGLGEEYPDIAPSNFFIGEMLRFYLLSRQGESERLLGECENAFLSMAESTGTLWELFNFTSSCNHAFASAIAPLIVRALTGYIRTDERRKVVYFSNNSLRGNTEVTLPMQDGKELKISVKNGIRKTQLPEGYAEEEWK